jgi:peptide-methionine (S)-S-oxide reductase
LNGEKKITVKKSRLAKLWGGTEPLSPSNETLSFGLNVFFVCNSTEEMGNTQGNKKDTNMTGIPATFAAGCFWGTERYFKKKFGPALLSAKVGYMGGADQSTVPTYKMVCTGTTGHAEVLQVQYDPSKVSFQELIDFFFRMHNPTTKDRQCGDKGTQYRSAIFYHDEEQKKIATEMIQSLNQGSKIGEVFGAGSTVVTTVEPASTFFVAEDYHQEYLDVNPDGYCSHRIYW